MLDLAVELHWTKTATVDIRRALQMDMAVARATAAHIRRRMLKGRTATRPEPFAGPRAPAIDKRSGKPRKRKYFISPAYAAELNVQHTAWDSSAELHAAIGGIPGHATGAMWKGLRVRNYGRQAALIEFAGSSLGASSIRGARKTVRKGADAGYEVRVNARGKATTRRLADLKTDKEGNVLYKSKAKKVRNSEKAGRVFKHTKIGALQPTAAESQAQLGAVAEKARAVVMFTFGAQELEGGIVRGDRRLFNAITREIG